MKKRALSLVLILVMLLGLLPRLALAADDATTTWLNDTNNQLYVGDTQVTAANADDILSGEDQGKASFAVVEGVPTLTLKGVNITTFYSEYGAAAGIASSAALAIKLEGDNTVAFDAGDSMAVGISTQGGLTITGSGSLKVSVASTSPMCIAVMAQGGTITVDPSMTIQGSMATGDTITLEEAVVVNNESGGSIYLKSNPDAPAKTVLIQSLPPHNHPVCGETCSHGGHSEIEYKPLSQSDFENSTNGVTNTYTTYTLDGGNYYLTEDITLRRQIQFPENAKVNLCLNGHKLQFESVNYGVFVGQSNTFRICDCRSGGEVAGQRGGLTIDGTLNLYGGTITSGSDYYGIKLTAGATVEITGGSVESTSMAVYNTGGTVNISGGSLKSNSICINNDQYFDPENGDTTPGTATVSGGSITGAGYGIQNYSKLTVTGGTITATGSASDCYGICNESRFPNDGTLTLSGAPAITGRQTDLGLYTGEGTAVAYAKVDATGYTGNVLTVTEGSPSEGAYAIKVSDESKDKFTLSDRSGYQYVYQDGGLMLHKHSLTETPAKAATCTTAGNNAYWTCSGCDKIYSDADATVETTVADMTINAPGHDYSYAAGGNTITQTCSRDNSHTHTLTINAPADLTYNGMAKEATVTGSLDGVTESAITYGVQGGEALPGAPVDAGRYTASVTAEGETAGVDFTIAKAAQEAPGVTITADAQATDSITLRVSGPDSGTLQYSKDGGTTWQDSPTFTGLTPGTAYEFTVRLAGDDNHDPSPAGAATTIYTVPNPPADDGTGLAYDYKAETVQAAEGYEISTDGGTVWIPGPVALDLDGTPPAVQVRKAEDTADGVTVPAGAAATVTLPGRPDAPEGAAAVDETVAGRHDGKLTGVTEAMEYSADSGSTWTACTGAEITGLAPGAYQVRAAATDHSFASRPTTVTVAEGAARTYMLTVTAPTFDEVCEGYAQPEAKAVTIQNSGNSDAAVTDVTVSAPDKFIIGGEGATVPAGGSIHTWTIRPAAGLSAGVHTAAITVTHDGETSRGDVTFTVNAPARSVSGVVTEGGAPVAGATVTLKRGSAAVAAATTDSQGKYRFDDVAPGDYNVAATLADRTVTVLVTVVDAAATERNLVIPAEKVNSVLVVEPDAPAVVVDGLDGEAQAVKAEAPDAVSVTVTMTVTGKTGSTADHAVDIKAAAQGRTLEYLEIRVEKTVDAVTQPITTTSGLMTVIIPFEAAGKFNVEVYRWHGSGVDTLTAEKNRDGEYIQVGDSAVTLYVKNFSTYAIGCTETADLPEPARPSQPSPGTPSTGQVPEQVDPACPRDETCPAAPFTDLDLAQWYHDGVHFCVERGLMIGTSDTTFEPETDATRAMLATILWRLQGSPVVNYALRYDDVADGTWYTEAVRWATSEGIVEGYGNGNFGPEDSITREQLATMLYRYEQRYGGGGFTGMWMFLLDYVDREQISEWAYEALCWMTMNGVVEGKGEKTLDPAGTATRAEAATMVQRFLTLK